MTSKVIQTITGNDVQYKVIKDGYKTITKTIHITDDMPTRTTYDLSPSTVAHNPELDYTIDTSHEYSPVITFNENVVTPDDTEITTNKYILAPYGQDYVLIDGGNDEDNFSRIGNVQVNKDGVVNGFSSNNYLTTDGLTLNNSVEFVFKFTTGTDITSFQNIFASYPLTEMYIENGDLKIWSETTSSAISCGSVLENFTYYGKVVIENGVATLSYSTDGVTYTGDVSISDTENTSNYTNIGFGVSGILERYFRGSIDLSESYIKINNEIWWQPTWNKLVPKYIPNGNVEVNNDGVAKNFSTSNYIKILSFQPESLPWKITTQVYLTQWGDSSAIFGQTGECSIPQLYVNSSGYLQLWISSNGSSWNIANAVTSSGTISRNAWHTLVLEFTGSSYRVLVDNAIYITVTNSNKLYRNNKSLCLGFDENTYFRGNIWLKNTTITYGSSTDNTFTWKYRGLKTINSNIIGEPIFSYDEKFMRGFGASNYFTKSIDLTDYNSFEIYMKILTPNNTDTNGAFFSNNTTGASPFRRDGTQLASWSSQQYIGSYVMPNNTSHWIKGYSDGTTWYLYGKVDEGETLEEVINSENWVLSGSCAASYIVSSTTNNFIFGRNTDTYSNQYFTGSIYTDDLLIKKDGNTIFTNTNMVGEEVPGILDSSYLDTGDQVTLNLYDVETNKRTLILNTNRDVTVQNKQYVEYNGEITIPDHGLSVYDPEKYTWSKYRIVTLNVNDEDTGIYTEGNI